MMSPSPQEQPVKFGVGVVPCRPVTEVADAIGIAEQAGFDVAWMGDSQLLWRDPYPALALAALRTTTIELATAVSNPVTRHPSVLASCINTIAELAPGRVTLGLGSGESAVKLLDLPPARLAEMREAIEVVRDLTNGRDHQFGGRIVRLRDAQPGTPVLLAASGPRTTRLAGEVADGVIAVAGVLPELISKSREALHEGRQVSGGRLPPPQLIVGAFCKVTDDIERDARLLKPICAYVASNAGGREYLRSVGIDLDEPPRLPALYPDMVHAEDWDQAVEYAAAWVTDTMAVRFAETFCLFGTEDQIAQRIERAVGAGATGFYLRHLMSYSLPFELIESFSGIITNVRTRTSVPIDVVDPTESRW